MKNFKLSLTFLILIALPVLTGCCKLFGTCEDDEVMGCTDPQSLNFDPLADSDDGSCSFSTAVFYGTYFSPYPPITVNVNGSDIGTVSAAYPFGPGNCSVPGVAIYSFENSERVDWVATDAAGYIFSGSFAPSSSQDCIKVRLF